MVKTELHYYSKVMEDHLSLSRAISISKGYQGSNSDTLLTSLVRDGYYKRCAGWVQKMCWMGKKRAGWVNKSAGWVKGSAGWVKKKCWMGKKEVLDG